MKNILDGNCAPCSQFLCPLQRVCWRTREPNCLETCVRTFFLVVLGTAGLHQQERSVRGGMGPGRILSKEVGGRGAPWFGQINWSGDELGQRSNAKPRWAKPDAVFFPFCRLDTTPGVLGEVKKGNTDKGKMAKSGLNKWRRMGPVPMGTKSICGLTSLALSQEVHITICWKPLQGLLRSLNTLFPCG